MSTPDDETPKPPPPLELTEEKPSPRDEFEHITGRTFTHFDCDACSEVFEV